MFGMERRHERLAPVSVFIGRIMKSIGFAAIILGCVLALGTFGYHWIAGFNWIDSILEASMILAGMGPVNPLPTDGAKLFASGYALFSGVFFIGVMGLLLTPLIHRIMHKFHLQRDEKE